MNNKLEKYYTSGRKKPEVLVEDIETLTNLEWRKMRQNGIGGSDAGEILNKSDPTFKTAFQVARSKIEQLEEDEKSPSDQFRLDFGHALEPVILEWYANTQNANVFVDRGMYKHPDHEFMLADCDGFAITKEGNLIGLEIKTTNFYKKKCWHGGLYGKDGIIGTPIYYVQVQHYMEVMDIDRFDIVVAFGNSASDIQIVTVPRDREFGKYLVQKEEEFWNNLEDIGSQMPDFVSPYAKEDTINKLKELGVKIDDESAVEKCESIIEKNARLAELKREIKNLEESIDADEILLLASINDNEWVNFGGKYKVRNKVSSRTSYDTKEMKKHPELNIWLKTSQTKKFEIVEVNRGY